MKEQLPSPEFDPSQYVRPTQKWICGNAASGHPCPIGPDSRGHCRATCECAPILEVREGETKGRYRCTRPPEHGGPCEQGPLPDGRCCRPISRCQPVRSVRAKRNAFTWSVIACTVGFLCIALSRDYRWQFVNPGALSSQHAGSGFQAAFVGAHPAAADAGDRGCAGCHSSAFGGPTGWVRSAAGEDTGLFQARKLFQTTEADMVEIDAACARCHMAHNFHQPNVAKEHSCSACHQEHQGAGLMKPPGNAECVSCHGNEEIMSKASEDGKRIAASAFDYWPEKGRQLFKAPRPENGYTRIIHSFGSDHPEFQVLAEKLPDPDTLKFNHRLHLTSPTIPLIDGRKLDCADCHKPDAAGLYHTKITFAENCQKCHSLQFDAANTNLFLPHGNPEFARAFLRSLPAQYAEYAARVKGLRNQTDIDNFVSVQIARLREQSLNGENLEREVFFSDARWSPAGAVGGQGRARFPGCAYCHEVKPGGADAAPVITKPVIMDRWLIRGSFDHSKHVMLDCSRCHDAANSTQTSDVLLPSKATCAECHSQKGGVASNCSLCHSFHAPAGSGNRTAQ